MARNAKPLFTYRHIGVRYVDLERLHIFMNSLPKSFVVSCKQWHGPWDIFAGDKIMPVVLDIREDDFITLKLTFEIHKV